MCTVDEPRGSRRRSEPEVPFCEENRRLLDAFGDAVRDLTLLYEQQFLAVVEGDADSNRFDILIHMATERKHSAKYDYLKHTDSHGC